MRRVLLSGWMVLLLLSVSPAFPRQKVVRFEKGFASLFDGESLKGWILMDGRGPGYIVEDGILICPAEGGGRLFTKEVFEDFILRFEFRLEEGGNNGVGIRSPLKGNPAYMGIEIQILDDYAERYTNLRPTQYHGSVYDIFPAKRGALKKPGAWNEEEIECRGTGVKVTVNGQVVVDADLKNVRDPEKLKHHPGIKRKGGHIGFLGHGSRVMFRNIRIKDLRLNVPPEGFTTLFNGKDLAGWKGLAGDPVKRARWSKEELDKQQKEADLRMQEHWKIVNDVLVFDGKGQNLCTAKDYEDFELLLDWKILPRGDSGIYLRGSPQVQIWDNEIGSGGLYNNQKNPSRPRIRADNLPGEWNRFRIRMEGDRVSVHLNGELVVDNVVMENYWERDKPIYAKGPIELQNHGNTLCFRNIFIRELEREKD